MEPWLQRICSDHLTGNSTLPPYTWGPEPVCTDEPLRTTTSQALLRPSPGVCVLQPQIPRHILGSCHIHAFMLHATHGEPTWPATWFRPHPSSKFPVSLLHTRCQPCSVLEANGPGTLPEWRLPHSLVLTCACAFMCLLCSLGTAARYSA